MQRTHFTAGYTLYVTNKVHLSLIIIIIFVSYLKLDSSVVTSCTKTDGK